MFVWGSECSWAIPQAQPHFRYSLSFVNEGFVQTHCLGLRVSYGTSYWTRRSRSRLRKRSCLTPSGMFEGGCTKRMQNAYPSQFRCRYRFFLRVLIRKCVPKFCLATDSPAAEPTHTCSNCCINPAKIHSSTPGRARRDLKAPSSRTPTSEVLGRHNALRFKGGECHAAGHHNLQSFRVANRHGRHRPATWVQYAHLPPAPAKQYRETKLHGQVAGVTAAKKAPCLVKPNISKDISRPLTCTERVVRITLLGL